MNGMLLPVLVAILVILLFYLIVRYIQIRAEQRLMHMPSLVMTPRDYMVQLLRDVVQNPEEQIKLMQALQRIPDQAIAKLMTSQIGHAVDKTGKVLLAVTTPAVDMSVVKTVTDLTMKGLLVGVDKKGFVILQRTEEQPLINILPYLLYKYHKLYGIRFGKIEETSKRE